MTGALEGKTCIITGGAGSLGAATARLFLAEGARVMLVDRSASALDALLAELDAGARLARTKADVSDPGETASYVAATLERFGGLDVLVSNAGNFGSVAPIASYPDEDFDATWAVHVRGAYLACKHASPHLAAGGSIVITSSVAATRGDAGVYGYITAKHAQIGLMRCLAKELAPRGIRVNTIHPGPIDNGFQAAVEEGLSAELGRDATAFFDELIPLHRHGRPEEIARSVLYLACDQSSYTTGSMLMVDGGMSA